MVPLGISQFRQLPIFQGFTDDEFALLEPYIEYLKIEPNEKIIQEGEKTSDIYFLLDGELAVTKQSKWGADEFTIGHVNRGEMFGEMACVDSAPRSSTIKALKHADVYKLAIDQLDTTQQGLLVLYDKLMEQLAKIILSRIRVTNRGFVQSLRDQIDAVEIKNQFGLFLALILFFYSLQSLIDFFVITSNMNINLATLSWIRALLLLIPSLIIAKLFHVSLEVLGLRWRHAPRVILETAMMLTSAYLVGWLIYGLTLGQWTGLDYLITSSFGAGIHRNYFALFFYVCVIEFVIRGVMQTSLQKFLRDQKGWLTVFLVADLLWLFDLYQGFGIANLKFCMDVVLGFTFLTQRTILGVVILHFVITALTGSYY